MDQAGQNSSSAPTWMKNFGMPKNPRENDALDRAIYAAKNQAAASLETSTSAPTASSSSASNPSASSPASSPTSALALNPDHPLSAKEIINARYQGSPALEKTAPRPTLSARDAINSARSRSSAQSGSNPSPISASLGSDADSNPGSQANPSGINLIPEPAKSASRLHRGFIQKSLESTRPSASAILGTNSPDGEVPVVSTSLKLGEGARPKKPVATLPPNARMARAAKSLDVSSSALPDSTSSSVSSMSATSNSAAIPISRTSNGKKLLHKITRAKSLEKRSVDAQIILPEESIRSEVESLPSKARSIDKVQSSSKAQTAGKSQLLEKTQSDDGDIEVHFSGHSTSTPRRRRARKLSGKVSQITVTSGNDSETSSESRQAIAPSDHDRPTTKSSARRARQPLGISEKIALGAGTANRQLMSDPQMISPKRPSGPRSASLARPSSAASASRATNAHNTSRSATDSPVVDPLAIDPATSPSSRNARLGAAVLRAILDGSVDPASLGLQPSDLQAIAAAENNQALKTALAGKTVGDLGVIEDYTPAEGRANGQKAEVVSGTGLSARDPKNPKAHRAEDSRRTLGKQSPFFLKSVNVEKRPLSHDNAGIAGVPARPREDSAAVSPEKPVKLGTVRTVSRKSTFAKAPKPPKEKRSKEKQTKESRTLPDRPTVIVPSSRRSNAPLFFLLILTILLGAAVGAAAYLCFFQ